MIIFQKKKKRYGGEISDDNKIQNSIKNNLSIENNKNELFNSINLSNVSIFNFIDLSHRRLKEDLQDKDKKK